MEYGSLDGLRRTTLPMTYDPPTATGSPTEPASSLPRPARLQAAYADYDARKITAEPLEPFQDEAVHDAVSRMELTGPPIVSDGEQRWSRFATYPRGTRLGLAGSRRRSWPE